MEKKSRGEMLLALFLYTFECFSVVSFSALMYQFYHFKSYRDFLQNFVDEHMSFLSFLPEGIPGFYGVVIGLLLLVKTYLIIECSYILRKTLQVTLVVLFSGLLILMYYKRLHPRLTMFSVQREGRHSPRSS